jgi:acyl-CoA reductase-like NAD-dependent aldehyde dehydrogenase
MRLFIVLSAILQYLLLAHTPITGFVHMEMLTVYSPYTRQPIDAIPIADMAQAEKMLDTAHKLFKNRELYLPLHKRVEILQKLSQLMKSKADELTRIAASEGGKPWIDSAVEVQRAILGVESAIQTICTRHGSEIPMGHTASSAARKAFTVFEPIGVVLAISAFNHPLNLIVHQVVPAIAAGTPILIKPASSTPRSCLVFVDLLHQAGLPEGWCQALICRAALAEQLVSDPRIAFLSFIGSGAIGWRLRSLLPPGARCALEHGGAAPVVYAPDYQVDKALPLLAKGAFYHSGQVCVSVQRIYAHADIFDELAAGLQEKAAAFRVGDPLDPATEAGPLIHPHEVDRVEQWIEQAVQGGATLLGGGRISQTCYRPAILLNPPQDAFVSTHEIFGPVVCLYKWDALQDAINRANSLPYGFQASVFTNDITTAFDAMQQLNASAVMLNDHTAFRVDWMPFGGRDASGLGMAGIPYTIHEYSREKMLVFHSPALL